LGIGSVIFGLLSVIKVLLASPPRYSTHAHAHAHTHMLFHVNDTQVTNLQYATFVPYVIWRMFGFVTLYQYTAEFFPPSIFGAVSMSAATVSGTLTLLTYALNPLVVYVFKVQTDYCST
jgi:hypothetical protein